jgi:cytidine deaminase
MWKALNIEYRDLESYEELDSLDRDLVSKAFDSSENAYAPYSDFKVGASVLLENGTIVLGNNQENIAYPSGLCAERVALFYAGANFSGVPIRTICVVAKGALLPFEKILSPCGSCRQVMVESEFRQENPIKVILVSQNKRTLIFNSVNDILPFSFGKD